MPFESLGPDDLRGMEEIGRGGFGIVYLLEHGLHGDLALKQIFENKISRERARKEAELWKDLDHPNILPLLCVLELPEAFYFVSPFQQHGSLSSYLQEHPESDKQKMIFECSSGLEYLHERGIIHGDIKSANVLVSRERRMQLCDFGLSRSVDVRTSEALRGFGSFHWMSPELFSGASRSFGSDVWAFGMMAYEILFGRIPFSDIPGVAQLIKAIAIDGELPKPIPAQGVDGSKAIKLWGVISRCWHKDPRKRPSITTIRLSIRWTENLLSRCPRKFRDLIKNASTFWPAWDPASAAAVDIQAGDYGHVDEDGEFHKEGTIINNPEFSRLYPPGTDLSDIQPVAQDRLTIVSQPAKPIDHLHVGADAIEDAQLKVGWSFGKRGALLVAYKPQQWSLPTGVNWKEFIEHPGLKGKCVVKDVWRCPAYACYLAPKGNHEIRLALNPKYPPSPDSGFTVSGSWISKHTGGMFLSGDLRESAEYTVLYTLRQPRKFSMITGWR